MAPRPSNPRRSATHVYLAFSAVGAVAAIICALTGVKDVFWVSLLIFALNMSLMATMTLRSSRRR